MVRPAVVCVCVTPKEKGRQRVRWLDGTWEQKQSPGD